MNIDLKQHPKFENLWISADGRIFQERYTHDAGCGGYRNVSFTSGGKGYKTRRAYLVCEAYKGARPDGLEVRHLNGIPDDDREENLDWGTHLKNMKDMVGHDRSVRGVKNPFNKLEQEEARKLKIRILSGESGSLLAREFGISRQLVCDIKYGRAWNWLSVKDDELQKDEKEERTVQIWHQKT